MGESIWLDGLVCAFVSPVLHFLRYFPVAFWAIGITGIWAVKISSLFGKMTTREIAIISPVSFRTANTFKAWVTNNHSHIIP